MDATKRKYGPGGDWSGRPIGRAVQTSIIHLGAGVQHVIGIRALLSAGAVIFPIAPLTRSIIEICGRIRWTMAPDLAIGDRARTARMLLIELDDVMQAKSLAKALGHSRELTKCADAVREVRTVRIPALFFPSEIDHTKGGDLILCGQRLPGLTESVATLNVPGLYAALSAATHPTLFRTLKMVDAPTPSAEDPGASVPLTFRTRDLADVATLVKNAVLALLQAWTALASYQGIDAEVLDDTQDEIVALAERPATPDT